MIRLAALDLGSNSFHILDATYKDNTLSFGQRIKEKVQLGAGLDGDMNLSQNAINRGIDCLQGFKRYIDDKNITQLIAVGTNTLRNATNSQDFLNVAEEVLDTPIQVISGEEEAELIFSAVIKDIDQHTPGLVIDIGGGSTEFATGSKQQIEFTKSLEMGCLSYYKRFFADGKIYSENVRAAEKAARLELEQILNKLSLNSYQWIAGTSGTMQSIAMLSQRFCNDPENVLRRSSIDLLEKRLILSGHVNSLNFEHLDTNRREILPSGLAIVKAIFNALNIEQITIHHTALCEGLLLKLIAQR